MAENLKNVKNQENQTKTRESLEKDAVKLRKKKKTSENKTFWITRSIAENIGREAVLKRTLIEFIIYAGFLILATLYVVGINTTSVYYLTRALRQQFLEQEFSSLNDVGIKFEDIKTAADFWFYVENHLIKSFFWESTYDPNSDPNQNAMNILHENKVLGVPRLRQVKVRNDSCIIHNDFRKLFLNCYNAYSPYFEDLRPFGPETNTAWVYTSPKKTESLIYWGQISTYNGGGFYVDLKRNKTETYKIIENLKDNLWISRGTRAVFVDFTVYNGNLNLFGICKLIFEFPSTGGIIPSSNFHSVRLLRFHSNFDWFIFACQCCCYIFIIFYLCEEIREMFYYKISYLARFWNYVDLLIIALFLIALVLSVYLLIEVPLVLNKIKTNPDKYGNLEHVTELHNDHNQVAAIALFLVYLKAFKFLNFNRTMGQLNSTLSRCARDILGFSLMFFIVFFAYSELGYLIFGNQVKGFSSFGVAMFTLLRTILGDFDYQEIEEANRILAPIYFLSYIFLVFFALLNMFLAIINDTYADVKTEKALAPNEMQMTEYLQKRFGKVLRKFGCGKFLSEKVEIDAEISTTIREIQEILKKCGYHDLEIEMFFSRYNINPLAEIHVKDSEKLLAELETVLKRDNSRENVKLIDFVHQQKRLNEIEEIIGELVRKVKAVLEKLESMENVVKEKNI